MIWMIWKRARSPITYYEEIAAGWYLLNQPLKVSLYASIILLWKWPWKLTSMLNTLTRDLGRGGGSQIWSGYGCKARPPTGWGIRWEHRLKKWGVIGWEHDFWHSVREKYKNMWGHRVRAKSSQKSRVFGWYLKQGLILQWCYHIGITWTWLVFSILDCKITKVKYIVFFSNASFSNHGALSDRLNEKIWVFGWELMQL